MNKDTSWRHHYIPQFYLNGFLSSNNTFKIYDVEKCHFIKNGMDVYPRSYFFEKGGNTLSNEEGSSDIIESNYAKLETKVSDIFNRINSNSAINKFGINDYDIAALQHFVGMMYWRNPTNYKEIKDIIKSKTLRNLGLILKDKSGSSIEDDEIENRIKENHNFFTIMKFWFAMVSYPETISCNTPLHIISLQPGLPSVCSDNPIICKNPDTFRVYTDDFILPLNNTKLFIRGELSQLCMTSVKVEIDCLIFKQARKYVSCTDEIYINMLNELYENNYRDLNELRMSIFRQVFKKS